MLSDDPIKNNLTWLTEDNVEEYFNSQAELADTYPQVGTQANSLGNLFFILALLCLIIVMVTFISKVGII